MNRIFLCGRLTRDAETRYTNGAEPMAISRFSLAVDRQGRDNETDFINCVAFGKNGQFAEKYLNKGMKIIVEGRLQIGSYENREGVKIPTADVIVDRFEFCEKKQQNGFERINAPIETEEDFMNVPEGEDDLPFAKPTR